MGTTNNCSNKSDMTKYIYKLNPLTFWMNAKVIKS